MAVACAAVLDRTGSRAHRFLFGALDPIWLTAAVCALGLLGLRLLERHGWVASGVPDRRVLQRLALLGACLALPVVLVDLLGGFPADMNVPLPDALLFYPSIAVVAEAALHVIPLAAVALVADGVRAVGRIGTGRARPEPDRDAPAGPGRAWLVGAALASLVEPALQVAWGVAHSPPWANAYVGVHLLVFNVVGVHVIRRRGFTAVWCYRISYYLVWHLVWGALRLELLFGAGTP